MFQKGTNLPICKDEKESETDVLKKVIAELELARKSHSKSESMVEVAGHFIFGMAGKLKLNSSI